MEVRQDTSIRIVVGFTLEEAQEFETALKYALSKTAVHRKHLNPLVELASELEELELQ